MLEVLLRRPELSPNVVAFAVLHLALQCTSQERVQEEQALMVEIRGVA